MDSAPSAGWQPDPEQPERLRYWDGERWTDHVSTGGVQTVDPQGWELVSVYDKASNWFNGMEKGFMLLKRPVAANVVLTDEEWCITVNLGS